VLDTILGAGDIAVNKTEKRFSRFVSSNGGNPHVEIKKIMCCYSPKKTSCKPLGIHL
jgi:hypothetical protein